MGKRWCIGMALFLLLMCAMGVFAVSAEMSKLGAGSLAVSLAEATPPTLIGFSPLRQEVDYGETITVSIQITDVVDLYAAQVHARFDPTILTIVDANSAEPGIQLIPGNIPPSPGFYQSGVNNQVGTFYYVVTLLGDVPAASGSGKLATVIFRAIGVGVTEVSITSVSMSRANRSAIQPIIGQAAEITVPAPDYPVIAQLTNSCSQSTATANDRLRYTIAATNRGAEGPIAILDYLPKTPLVSLITSTLTATLGALNWEPAANEGFGLIQWEGQLGKDQTVTITFEMVVGRAWQKTLAINTVVFQSFVAADVTVTNVTTINPPNTFLPLLLRLYQTGR